MRHERKTKTQVIAELRESWDYLQTIINGIMEPVLVIDRGFRIVLANKAALESLRIDSTTIHPCWWCHEVAHGNEAPCDRAAHECPVQHVIATRAPVRVTHTHKDRDGNTMIVEILASPILDGQGEVKEVIQTYRDITARRKAETLLQQRHAQFARASRLTTLGEIASGLAHEINQPLAAVASYSGACITRLTQRKQADKKVLSNLRHIADQAKLAGDIIRRIRGFVRPKPTCHAVTDINAIIEDSVSLLSREAAAHGVTVQLELAPSPVRAPVDRTAVEQVVINLLRNSIEAMHGTAPGDRRLTVWTGCTADRMIETRIKDNGCGFAASSADHLFDMFFTTKPHGMGMGLAISRSAIEAHGGRLWAETNPSGGATFTFHLPTTDGTQEASGDGDDE